jgi:hypothetical protein
MAFASSGAISGSTFTPTEVVMKSACNSASITAASSLSEDNAVT